MNKLILLFIIPFFTSAQQWDFVANYDSDGRHHPVTFASDNFGFVLTGQNNSGEYLSDVLRYDVQSNSWDQLADFPGGGRGYAYGVSDGTNAYVGFGSINDLYPTDWWVYSIPNNSWEELQSFPSLGRNHPAMVLSDGKIFVGMGSSDGFNFDDWWAYNILNDTWSQLSNFPFGARHHPFYFSIDKVPYVGFGHGDYTNNGNIQIYNDFYRYDVSSDNWIQLNDFPSEARVAGTQFSYNGKGYIMSGDGDDHGPLDSGELWQYDPLLDSWTQLTSHPGGARWAPGSFVIGCNVYLTSGYKLESDTYFNDLLKFKLSADCGCMDELALNYNQEALFNDNSCCYLSGCTEPYSMNYNDNACIDDGSCIPTVLGCTDSTFTNFNSLANTSSGFTGFTSEEFGSGGFHYNDMWDMVFNCYETVTLKSIDLYAESSFSTQIEIIDVNENQIYSSIIALETGLNQVELDFVIFPGNDYKIGINGSNDGLYRNSSVADGTFPINLFDVIEITSNTTEDPLDFFYYFYNWQLEVVCQSNLGCTDLLACNYNSSAITDDNSCTYASEFYDCDQECLNDFDIDGICDELDNCPEIANPDQEDNNSNNVGDVCDNLSIDEVSVSRNVVKIIDILGRISKNNKGFTIYLYDDGTAEKKYSFD